MSQTPESDTPSKRNPKSREEFKTLLIFPPQWTPQNPHLAITSLAGHLRHHGNKVILRDLNVEFYDEVLTPEYLSFTFQRIRMAYDMLNMKCKLRTIAGDTSLEYQIEGLRCMGMEKFLKEGKALIDYLPRSILDAKETFRDPRRFYNPSLLLEAFLTIDRAMEVVSLPYYPAKMTFNSFEQPHCLLATDSIIKHASDKRNNMFFEFFEKKIPGLLKEKADLYSVSINSFSQVLPGLTLARLLKRLAPAGTYINVGGNFFGRLKEPLMGRPEFFREFCHTLCMGEGEKQLVELVEQLRQSEPDLSKVQNILYSSPDEKTVSFSIEEEPERLNNLGFQDLEGLPLDKYFAPHRTLAIQSSKGCYYGQCTFCDSDFGVKKDVKDLDRLIEEIKYLKEKYGVVNYEFIDESIRPAYMVEMAKRFIEEGLDIHWFCNGRIEEAFTPETLDLLCKSGLTMVLWGFESGNRRIMNLINKGINLDGRLEILRSAADLGVWNFAYIFFGFPTESREEAWETINTIVDHTDIIDSYGRSVFTLGRHSKLRDEPAAYGIRSIVEDLEELSTNLHYVCDTGMSDEDVDDMMNQCTDTCVKAYGYALWYALRYRENLHLYLAKHGKEYVKNYKLEYAVSRGLQIW
jgi:radical SAM superfamily enzyme YgiQ (UPF0313 family)